MVAGLGAFALFAGSCGVANPDVAATYEGTDIAASTVEALATDEAFAALMGFQVAESSAVLDGTGARAILDFLLQGEALIDAAQRLGIDVEPDEALLAETIQGLQSQGYNYSTDDLSDEARGVLSRVVAADQAVSSAGAEIDGPTEGDITYTYEALAESGRWSQVCVDLVAGPADLGADSAAAVSGGTDVLEVPEEVSGMQIALDSTEQCATAADLAGLPPELSASIESADVGEVVGPVEVDDGGQPLAVLLVVRSRGELTFEDVREELSAQVAQSLLAVRIARGSEVNPQYGSGVGLELTQGPASQTGAPTAPVLTARVSRPDAPEVSAVVAQ